MPRSQTAELDAIIARTLGITTDQISDNLAYQSVPQWDSLHHVALMVVLERTFKTRIDNDMMLELGTIQAIRSFAASRDALASEPPSA